MAVNLEAGKARSLEQAIAFSPRFAVLTSQVIDWAGFKSRFGSAG
jgi:hypothetical protein